MTQDQSKFGEQAINKIAEIALASQLEEAKQLEVRVKTDLSKLARGEIDSIAINIYSLLIEQEFYVEELNLQIGRVTVKPFSAVLGKIKLVHPSQGTLRLLISEGNLTRFLNSQPFLESLHQQQSIRIEEIKCSLLADSRIVFNTVIADEVANTKAIAFTADPYLEANGQEVALRNLRYLEGKEPPPELVKALLTRISELLSLRNFARQGMSLQIQQLDVVTGSLTLQAAAYIEQFPSS
ncbi:DUF2993 domain-containing protein [Leptolyngbya sp. FACHB-261]|uniref:LmeA family phospholipid-binding protein n=1 Tax=Leptolyngbya sp. FACHB-261 TaxID=2692806 RepID=UPI0016887F26|nr:DUF2993 domain-containing protein [Leptolyngbya sp. FACHB-261]MBD2100078.1 DUF2993 domain-containing protein [Leptolyngbya sp. FACHB-261]